MISNFLWRNVSALLVVASVMLATAGPAGAANQTPLPALPTPPAAPVAPTPPVTPSSPTAAAPSPLTAPVTVPFRYVNNKIVIDVHINGNGPYSLALDSGSETMIITEATAKKCHLPMVSGNVEVSGTTGSFVATSMAVVEKLQIGDATVTEPVCTVATRTISFDGYIGAPLFNAYTVQVDFGKRMLSLFNKGSYVPDPADVAVPVVFGAHRVPVASGTIGGLAATFEIDTGSAFDLELLPDFVKTNHLTDKFQKLGSTITSSVDGPARADVYDLKTLALGAGNPIDIDGAIQAVFLPTAPSSASFSGRIGAPMLSRLVVTFDYAQSKMYLRPIPPPAGISL